jgi:hypothetical protein
MMPVVKRNASIDGDFHSRELSRLDKIVLSWHGRRDGRRGLPQLPSRLNADGSVPMAETPALARVQGRVDQIAKQHVVWLKDQHADLVAEIQVRASEVVYRQDVTGGSLTRAQTGRFLAALSLWSEAASAQRARVQAVAAWGSQQVGWYWAAVQRHHVRLRAIARQREDPPVTLWSPKPGAPPQPVQIDLSAWRPAPVRLDPEWDRPVLLLMDPAELRSDPRRHQNGVLARALDIVYGQA